MNYFRRQLILAAFAALFISAVLVVPALAQDNFGVGEGSFGVLQGTDLTLREGIVLVVQWLLGFLGIVAVLVMLYGGWIWMKAGGSADEVTRAKRIIIQGLIGLVIILSSFAIVAMVFRTTSDFLNNGGETCTPGEERSCSNSGCSGGVRVCDATGHWGSCGFGNTICVDTKKATWIARFSAPSQSNWEELSLGPNFKGEVGVPNAIDLSVTAHAYNRDGGITDLKLQLATDQGSFNDYNRLFVPNSTTSEEFIPGPVVNWDTSDKGIYVIDTIWRLKTILTPSGNIPSPAESRIITANIDPLYCFDGLKSGDETGIDCGGSCTLQCNQIPIIDAVTPDNGAPGNFVTITGRHFGADPGTVSLGSFSVNFPNNICSDTATWQPNQIIFEVPDIVHQPYEVKVETAAGYVNGSENSKNFTVNDIVRPGICSVENTTTATDPDSLKRRGQPVGNSADPVRVRGTNFLPAQTTSIVWNFKPDNVTSSLAIITNNNDASDVVPENRQGRSSVLVYNPDEYSNPFNFMVSAGGVGAVCGFNTNACSEDQVTCNQGLSCSQSSCTCQEVPSVCGDNQLGTQEDCDIVNGTAQFQKGSQCSAYNLGNGAVSCRTDCRLDTTQCELNPARQTATRGIYGWQFLASNPPGPDSLYVLENCDRGFTCDPDAKLPSPTPWFESDTMGWTASTTPSDINDPRACINTIIGARMSTRLDPASITDTSVVVLKCNSLSGGNCQQVRVNSFVGPDNSLASDLLQLTPQAPWIPNTWYKVVLTSGVRSIFNTPLTGNPNNPNRLQDGQCAVAYKDLSGADKNSSDTGVAYCWNFQTRPSATPCAIGCVNCTPDPTRNAFFMDLKQNSATPDSADNACLSLNPNNYQWQWKEKEYTPIVIDNQQDPYADDRNWQEILDILKAKLWTLGFFGGKPNAFSFARQETIFDQPPYVRIEAKELLSNKIGYCKAINDFTNPIVIEDRECRNGTTQSPSPWKGSTDACINAAISARFSRPMVDSTITFNASNQSTIRLERCTEGDNCLSATSSSWGLVNSQYAPNTTVVVFNYARPTTTSALLGGALTSQASTSSEEALPEGFVVRGLKDLDPNTWYRVVIRGGNNGVRGARIGDDGQENNTDKQGVLVTPSISNPVDLDEDGADDYYWVFKTNNSNTQCAVESVNVSPSNLNMRRTTDSRHYSAQPQAANCNVLDATDYQWQWRSLIGLGDDDNSVTEPVNDAATNDFGSGSIIASVRQWNTQPVTTPDVDVFAQNEGETHIKARVVNTRPSGTATWHEDKWGFGYLNVGLGNLRVTRYQPQGTSQCTNENISAQFNLNVKSATLTDKSAQLFRCADNDPSCSIAQARPVDLEWIVPKDNSPLLTSVMIASSTEMLERGATYRVILDKTIQAWNNKTLGGLNYRRGTGAGEECEPGIAPWSNQNICTTKCLLDTTKNICGTEFAQCEPTKDAKGNIVGDSFCSPACHNLGNSNRVSCGNGVIEVGEACDDGNQANGDSCSNRCLLTGSNPNVGAVCGNAIIERGEQCDDGNQTTGDSCSNQCLYEANYHQKWFSGKNDGKISTTSVAIGGKNVVFTEACDDGNATNGDGCNQNFLPEGSSANVPVCGNGHIERGESCDDGNLINGDSCSNRCLLEGSTGSAVCGNKQVEVGQNDSYSWTFKVSSTATACSNVALDHNPCPNGVRKLNLHPNVSSASIIIERGSDANPDNKCISALADGTYWQQAIGQIKQVARRLLGRPANAAAYWCPVTRFELADTAIKQIARENFYQAFDTANQVELIGERLPDGRTGISLIKEGVTDSQPGWGFSREYRISVDYDLLGAETSGVAKITDTTYNYLCPLDEVGTNVWPQGELKARDTFFCNGNDCGRSTLDDPYDDDQSPDATGNQHLYRAWAYSRLGLHDVVATGGHAGGAYKFNGATSHVVVAPSALPANEGTIDVWVRPDAFTLDQPFESGFGWPLRGEHIVYGGTNGDDGFGDHHELNLSAVKTAGGVSFALYYGSKFAQGVEIRVDSPNYPADTWRHVTASYRNKNATDDGEIVLYVDGKEVGRKTVATELERTDWTAVYVGRSPRNPVRNFTGVIDEVRFYRQALTPKALSNNALSTYLSFDQTLANRYPVSAQFGWNILNIPSANVAQSDITTTRYQGDQWITAGSVSGDSQASITAIGSGGTATGEVTIQTFLCANPWPTARDFPFRDSANNCRNGNCINTNFETYYCRDQKEATKSDDLPSFGNYDPDTKRLRATINSTDPKLIKEFLLPRTDNVAFDVRRGTAQVTGLRNDALEFRATTQSVLELNGETVMPLDEQQGTIALWAKPGAQATNGGVILSGGGGGRGLTLGVRNAAAGKVSFFARYEGYQECGPAICSSESAEVVSAAVDPNAWHQLIVTYDDSYVGLTVVPQGQAAQKTSILAPGIDDTQWTQFRFGQGQMGAAASYYTGLIDEVRLYRQVLADPAIDSMIAGTSPDPSTYYSFDQTVNDAIGFRVAPNTDASGNQAHLNPDEWYRRAFATSSKSLPGLIVDGYRAVRDGRTTYVGASDLNPIATQLFSLMYIASHNETADADTRSVYTQLIQNWHFNSGATGTGGLPVVGACSIPSKSTTVCTSNNDCRDQGVYSYCDIQTGQAGSCSVPCVTDSQCQTGGYGICKSDKAKLTRDTLRLGDANVAVSSLGQYYSIKRCNTDHARRCTNNSECQGQGTVAGVCGNFYPLLTGGTYVASSTLSVWPSWQQTLGGLVGSLPIDPINRVDGCSDPYNPATCWSETLKQCQVDPAKAWVYVYRTMAQNGGAYALKAHREFVTPILELGIQQGLFSGFDNAVQAICKPPIVSVIDPVVVPPSTPVGDQCPFDSNKTAPGVCGCGTVDDANNDGVADCEAVQCPGQSTQSVTTCGCGSDTDNDAICNAVDNCQAAPNPTQEDVDRDKIGDMCDADVRVAGKQLGLDVTGLGHQLRPFASAKTAAAFYNYRYPQSGIADYGLTAATRSTLFAYYDTTNNLISLGLLHGDGASGGSGSFTLGIANGQGVWPTTNPAGIVTDDENEGINLANSSVTWNWNAKGIDGMLVPIGTTTQAWSVQLTKNSVPATVWVAIEPSGSTAAPYLITPLSSPIIVSNGNTQVAPQQCGNGQVEGTEKCDCGTSPFDYIFATGNKLADGRTWLCLSNNNINPPSVPYSLNKKQYYTCGSPTDTNPANRCQVVVSADTQYCGDGAILSQPGMMYEQCEPGLTNSFASNYANSSSSHQYQCASCQQAGGYCGDGIRNQIKNAQGVVVYTEACDNGGVGKGCTLPTANDSGCKIEAAYECTGDIGRISRCQLQCGNGKLDSGEQCDFGGANNENGACTMQCQKNVAFACTDWAKPDTCIEIHNNGICDAGENFNIDPACPILNGAVISLKMAAPNSACKVPDSGETGVFLSVNGDQETGDDYKPYGLNVNRSQVAAWEQFTVTRDTGGFLALTSAHDGVQLKYELQSWPADPAYNWVNGKVGTALNAGIALSPNTNSNNGQPVRGSKITLWVNDGGLRWFGVRFADPECGTYMGNTADQSFAQELIVCDQTGNCNPPPAPISQNDSGAQSRIAGASESSVTARVGFWYNQGIEFVNNLWRTLFVAWR